MKGRKLDWNILRGILGALVVVIAVIICMVTSSQKDRTTPTRKNGIFVTIEQYYNDDNKFEKIVYDPDTMVMYAIIDGKLMTPLYNEDGSFRTYSPE